MQPVGVAKILPGERRVHLVHVFFVMQKTDREALTASRAAGSMSTVNVFTATGHSLSAVSTAVFRRTVTFTQAEKHVHVKLLS